MSNYDKARQMILKQAEGFTAMAKEYDSRAISFKRESEFALQLLKENDYLLKAAMNNPDSLQHAIMNIAATGLSLNPVSKHAYLVPRAKRAGQPASICLDISYMGMVNAATRNGSIEWVKADVVYSEDTFLNNGPGQLPTHTFPPFADNRGEFIGAYVAAKLPSGDYLVEMMSEKEIRSIAARSPAYKKNQGPWATDFNEMAKKTVVKRAAKLWPSPSRNLEAAIGTLNEHEGIDLAIDPQDSLIDENVVNEIRELLESIDREDGDKYHAHLSTVFKREITCLGDLTMKEAKQAIAQLKQLAGGQSEDKK